HAIVAHILRQIGLGLQVAHLRQNLIVIWFGGNVEIHPEPHLSRIVVYGKHVEHVVDALHLLLDRCCNRLFNCLSIRTDVVYLKQNFGRRQFGILRYRQTHDGNDTDDHSHDGNNDSYDRVIGEEFGHSAYLVGASGAGCAAAVAVSGFGLTAMPSRTFWIPSATTRSPGFNPSAIIQSVPIRSPTLTGRM